MVDRSAMHGGLLVVDDFTDGTPCQARFGAIGFLLQKLKHIHRKANALFMQCFLQLQRMHMIQLLSTWDHTEDKIYQRMTSFIQTEEDWSFDD